MDLTQEELEKVKEYAGLFLKPIDIAVLLDKPEALFKALCWDPSSEIYHAYRKGQVEAKLKLRRPVIKMAEHGSPQAEILADKYINEQLMSELDG